MLVKAPPRIAPTLFAEVLTRSASPAAAENTGNALYQIPLSYGLDPAVALAFFQHESSFGTRGLAVTTRNWGNLRRSPSGRGQVRPIPGRGNFAHYTSWADSLHDWCVLILGSVYVGAGRDTVAEIVPVYAPASDNNVPSRYIAAVETAVHAWERVSRLQGWMPAGDPWEAWGAAFPLPPEQRSFAIPQAWRAATWLGAATSPEVALGPQQAARGFARGVIVWLGGQRTEIVQ